MIIELKNFGPIEHFEFDTEKQMHFIFGENNIGKSYAISAVYLILKNIIELKGLIRYHIYSILPDENQLQSIENTIIDKVKKNENTSVTYITQEWKDLMSEVFVSLYLTGIQKSFSSSFNIDNLQNVLSKTPLRIHLKFNNIEFVLGVKKETLYLVETKLNYKVNISEVITNRSPVFSEDKNVFRFYFNTKNETISSLAEGVSLEIRNLQSEIRNCADNVYFLPASRSGLYSALSAFSAIIVELSQNRNFLRARIELPSISEPLSDYFLNLSSIKNKEKIESYAEYGNQIEEKILKGKVVFNSKTKKLFYVQNRLNFEMDLSSTSSMISEIAPIVAHLKYIIESQRDKYFNFNNLLFIEEPEAHLHPKIQVELIKLFAELAKKGLKIVMTSHSNYMFNKLSNMILAKEISPENINVAHMKMGEKGSFVDRNSMHVDEFGIEDDNFADTAEELYAERMKLYEQTH